MAQNQISTSQIVVNDSLAEMHNNMTFLVTGPRRLEEEFAGGEYRKGQTIDVRKQNKFIVGNGRVAIAQAELQATVPLTITEQFNVRVEYSSRELTLFKDGRKEPFLERTIRPAVQEIAKQAEDVIAKQFVKKAHYAVGTPGTPLNTYRTVALATAKMQKQAMPLYNAYMAINPTDAAEIKSTLQGSFNEVLNKEISQEGKIKRLDKFDLFSNQSIQRHIAGTGATGSTLKIKTAPLSGTNTLEIKDATVSSSAVFAVGDVITIGVFGASNAVNSVNPRGRASTGDLMQFVVIDGPNAVDDVLPDGTVRRVYNSDGAGDVTIDVEVENGPFIYDPSNPRRNISKPIDVDQVVTIDGANTTYNVNVAYSAASLAIAMPPMPVPEGSVSMARQTDPTTGISIRVDFSRDSENDLNTVRFDMLMGQQVFSEYCVRVHT